MKPLQENDLTAGKFRSATQLLLLFSVLILIVSAIVFQVRVSRFGITTSSMDSFLVFVLCSLFVGISMFFAAYFSISKPLSRWSTLGPAVFFSIVVICGLVDTWTSNSRFFSYGDIGELKDSVSSIGSDPNPRWVLGSFFLALGRWTIDTFLFSIDVQRFIETTGALLFLITSIVVLVRSNRRASYIVPLFVPIWLAFGTGYDEYQPFLAPVALLVLLHILTQDKSRTFLPEAIIVGLLPAIYVGFLPLSILFFAHAIWSKALRTFLSNVFLSVFVYLIAIEISWSMGVRSYFVSVVSSLQLGDAGPGAIKGTSLSSRSMFFDLRSVFSVSHLTDLLYMLILGGGVAAIFLGWITLTGLAKKLTSKSNVPRMTTRKFSAPQVLTISWSVLYLVFLMAKLGPTGDIDAFYFTYFMFAIMLGICLDQISIENKWTFQKKALITGFVCGLNAPMLLALVALGVNRSCDMYSGFRSFC
jgi:hypothetical protein